MKNCLGLATCFYPDSSPERWKTAADGGFSHGEIDTNNSLDTNAICQESQKVYDDLKAGGIQPTSLHLPFGTQWDISAVDETFRTKLLEELKTLIRWSGERQIPIVILHPSFEPIADEERPARMEAAVDSIQKLGAFAKEQGVQVAVENLPRTCLGNCGEEMLVLTGNGEYAGICFDVNHLLQETHRDFVAKTGPYLITTHLSDYDRINERHWLPGDGCIDWQELRQLLEGCGYSGRYLFELGENASPSLGRPFTPAELLERFQQIFC